MARAQLPFAQSEASRVLVIVNKEVFSTIMTIFQNSTVRPGLSIV